ncbi:MAG: DNA-binding protein [Gammaproteobacteria bacterium]|nr:DNA-binding protein [Gammaproteobacteria bacterium]
MKTRSFDVKSCAEALAEVSITAQSGRAEYEVCISFATPELLCEVRTAKRWGLIKKMCGARPLSIRKTAWWVDRYVKAVHGDMRALLQSGELRRTDDEGIEFPYGAINVKFLFNAAR